MNMVWETLEEEKETTSQFFSKLKNPINSQFLVEKKLLLLQASLLKN